VQRPVAPFVVYADRNESEVIAVFPGAKVAIGFHGADVAMVDVLLQPRYPDVFTSPRLTLTFPDGTVIPGRYSRLGPNAYRLRYLTPHGVPAGSEILAADRTSINRIIGYEPVPGFRQTGSGPVIIDQARLCAPPRTAVTRPA
jgi:hypothetical protein